MRISNFVIEYFRKTLLACSCGAHVESLEPKNKDRKPRYTVPLSLNCQKLGEIFQKQMDPSGYRSTTHEELLFYDALSNNKTVLII